MKKLGILLLLGSVIVGCNPGGDAGELPPARKPMTKADIDAMPPQARAAMESAQKNGSKTMQTRGLPGKGN